MEEIRISLDARPLSTPVSGVGRLIAETLLHFPNPERYRFYLHSHLPLHPGHEKISKLKNVEWVQEKGVLSKKGGLFFLFPLPLSVRKIRPQLFWGSQQVSPFFLPSNLPVVLTYCDLVVYFYPGTMRKIAAFQQKLFQRFSVKKAKAILSISKATAEDVCKFFSYPVQNSYVAYPGVSMPDIQSSLNLEKSERIQSLPSAYLLSVSTIEPRKNYPFLLKVYREYRKIAPNPLPWVILGKVGWETPGFQEELKQEIREFEDIILIEKSTDTELHHIYRNSEVFLFASIYEGFGIPLLEALSHGKKCLASDIPTFREIGGDSIPYLPIDSPQLWAEKIIELQENPKVPIFHPEEFSWERSAKITAEVFEKVLKNER